MLACDSCGLKLEEAEGEYCDECSELFCEDCFEDANVHGANCLDGP